MMNGDLRFKDCCLVVRLTFQRIPGKRSNQTTQQA
jgi:hypothetical protein